MIIEKQNTEYYQCRIPGIVCSDQGSLIAYYECRSSSSDWARIDIKIIKSTDDGITWRKVKLIRGDGHTLNNPVMFVKDGRLHFLYCENYRRVFYMVSSDDGENWSQPRELTEVFQKSKVPHTVLALGPGHGIVTSQGVMVIPVWFAYNEADPFAHKPSVIGTFYSCDDGDTWQVGEMIDEEFLLNPSECALGMQKDGSILMSIRNESPCRKRCFAVSPNGYEKWQEIRFDDRFDDPICQGSMANGDGILCHMNCSSKTERKNLTIKVSMDDFSTFSEKLVDGTGGYADLCIKDRNAYVLYEETILKEDDWDMNLHFKKVAL